MDIIVEIGQAHDGSLGMAHAYIDAVAKTGCNAIKFQTHIAEAESCLYEPFRVKFSKQDTSRFAYWKRMEFSLEQWKDLKEHCDEVGIEFMSSPFSNAAVDLLEEAGALVLKDTCPEVTPYNRNKYNHILTNSLKAEHYLTSGLNKMPTSVSTILDCVEHAFNPNLIDSPRPTLDSIIIKPMHSNKTHRNGSLEIIGKSLPSQKEWSIEGQALVTDVPITYLGYVNRDTGIIEEKGHPLDGTAIEDTILIYPKGSGSTVAPFVLMGLIYTGKGPRAIVNCDVCPLTLPAASLLNVPYAHGFESDPTLEVNTGDQVSIKLIEGVVSLSVISRVSED